MGRAFKICLCCLLCCLLPLSAMAADQITTLQSVSSVTSEGECQVSLYVTLHLDAAQTELKFPLPASARDIKLNGDSVSAKRSGSVREVDLLRRGYGAAPGDFSLNFQYSLSGLVESDEDGKLILTLPLLSGFAYPVTEMEFTVTMPGPVQSRPGFSSGYYRESIESSMSVTTEGSTISGVMTHSLKDKETLVMTLEVPQEQFPTMKIKTESGVLFSDIAAIICGALALLYWVLTLRCLPVLTGRRPNPPEGTTAGELGSRLIMVGGDLTMMVMTWAQLGYILIQMDDNGRVLLHKRMGMGNERSGFEVRIFKKLFGRKKYMVDGTGYHYAQLCRQVAKMPVKTQGLFRKTSGNVKLFRILSAGVGLFGGISVALNFSDSAVLGTGLAVVLGALGAASAWAIQNGVRSLHLRDVMSGRIAMGACLLWLILGFWSGASSMAVAMVASQLLTGLAWAYGGRRNEQGRQVMQEVLGLRRYLKKVSREEVQRIQESNPDYFFELMPYALALGVEKQFARHFGGQRLPDCAYLVTRMGSSMTAWEWVGLFHDVMEALDQRQKQLPLERLFGK